MKSILLINVKMPTCVQTCIPEQSSPRFIFANGRRNFDDLLPEIPCIVNHLIVILFIQQTINKCNFTSNLVAAELPLIVM